ncbi:MAG: hypothetical protein DKT66_22545 [Candidatus Melainabacteria bacterium]|nr:MAG: hypothetical protein DKT66_22545 [Candidatus Melainabacteria bacterium]
MRFSPSVTKSSFPVLAAVLLLNGAFLMIPCFAQSYGDVTVRKNPDGSIETFDTSSSSAPTPRRASRSGYKRGAQKYSDGVVVRKNADGSIETFDSGDGAAPRHYSDRHSSSRTVSKYSTMAHSTGAKSTSAHSTNAIPPKSKASSAGVHKFVHKYSKDVTVKKNSDGTIEVIGFEGPAASKGKSQSSAKVNSSAKASNAVKSSSTSKLSSSTQVGRAATTKHHSARRPRVHGNFGDVRVIRNPDGSIETYDSN